MKPLSDFTKRGLVEKLEHYEKQFPGSPGEKYITERGLSSETARFFRLGWTGDPLPEDRHLSDRVAIPYLRQVGPTAVRYRAIRENQTPKIQGIAGIPAKQLFNAGALWSTETLFICEGEIDAMTVHQMGLPAVGVAGVSNWDKAWFRVFTNHRCVVLADNDDNGQGQGLAEEIQKTIRDCSTLVLPSGHDVNSFYTEVGEDALGYLIDEHLARFR